MVCERCDGLMVRSHYIDIKQSGGQSLQAWKCGREEHSLNNRGTEITIAPAISASSNRSSIIKRSIVGAPYVSAARGDTWSS